MLIDRFLRNEKGNIAMMFAGSMMAICCIVGFSVDYSRLMNAQQDAQNVLDASLLAAATEYQKTGKNEQAIAVGKKHMTASIPGLVPKNLEIKVIGKSLTGSYNDEIDNTFLSVFLQPTSYWSVDAQIRLGNRPTTDFALAIDVSNTMVKNNLMTGLKSSLQDFSEQAFNNTKSGDISVSVVPFANAVSFEPEYDRWLDPIEGYSQTTKFIGCFEYESLGGSDALSTVGNSKRIAADDRRKHPDGDNVPFCPETGSNAELYIDQETDLSTKFSGLTTGQGTNTAEGLTWAWRALSTNWRNVFNESATYPRSNSATHNKVIVLLTDGRPYALPSVKTADQDKDQARAEALTEFREVCDQIIAAGDIDLYSIVYGNIMNEDQRTAIMDCTAGDGRSYWGGNSDQLSAIFSNIVNLNNALALSK